MLLDYQRITKSSHTSLVALWEPHQTTETIKVTERHVLKRTSRSYTRLTKNYYKVEEALLHPQCMRPPPNARVPTNSLVLKRSRRHSVCSRAHVRRWSTLGSDNWSFVPYETRNGQVLITKTTRTQYPDDGLLRFKIEGRVHAN